MKRWTTAGTSASERRCSRPWRALIESAYAAGADGACLAGAGPSVLALCSRDPRPVQEALQAAADSLSVPGTVLTLRPRNFGARVEVNA